MHDSAIQKPVPPFLEAVGDEAMNTEISILRSKSVVLRVATELHLDKDPEFQPGDRLAVLAKRLGIRWLARVWLLRQLSLPLRRQALCNPCQLVHRSVISCQ